MDATVKKRKTDVPDPTETGPVKVFRIEDVSASVFARDRVVRGEPVTFFSVSFSRSYKTATGERKYTKNFDEEDLGAVMALAKQAGEYIQAARVA